MLMNVNSSINRRFSRRNLQQSIQEVMALLKMFSKPDLFIALSTQ
jgi:hypothetical protein